jgi:hypothetical protein
MGKGEHLGGFEQLTLLALMRRGDEAYGVNGYPTTITNSSDATLRPSAFTARMRT